MTTTTLRSLRRLTGFTPSGRLHLGNLLGAVRPVVDGQDRSDTVVFLSDLHALTIEHDPGQLRARTLEQATLLLAAGLDPRRALLYVQSQVPQHTELHYLLECVTGYGEAHRMIQFKEKSAAQQQVRLSLLTYPVLMAADILLHDADEVPVGDDQTQHLELARDLAVRFNARYGPTFTVPRAVRQQVATRVMDLTEPTRKMSKSAAGEAGSILLLDPPRVIRRKLLRAVTDSGRTVGYDPVRRPGVANLLEILAACTGGTPDHLAETFSSYGELKQATADAVIGLVEPVQQRYAELAAAPEQVREILAEGAVTARARTAGTVDRVRTVLGLA
ncbi:tryptophan--tRNA ligase [Micromonospora echinofusca]|uniref:Tryptophan--tRNA ligase n=1 Tax=Micromonospora echinofusca TaxID=47858 RepID=A0ABS3VX93_MICEH|nr:tryptophan--tRNA ligase [Micromonospora echinofusca]MBO4209169.1 tryptophan--tRNA ligase [Micromonospora echinofusca]